MKKVITSFGVGPHTSLLSLSVPTLYLYADNHNYDIFLPSNDFFSEKSKANPPSWWKLDVIEYLFNTYDQVLWLDADVIICRFEEDISVKVNSKDDFGAVVHETPDGQILNCGVWFLNKSSLKWLSSLKSYNKFKRSSCWWEQAALLHIMGMNPDDEYIKIPEHCGISWTQLDYSWNPHINDHRKIPPDTKFFHATCFRDRYAIMKNILQQINI